MEHLAWILAAEEHPHLKEEDRYIAAVSALEQSPDLQAKLQNARDFLQQHPVLTQLEGLPQESRERISQVLQAEMGKTKPRTSVVQGPWGVRRQFAWAAALALLLAGMSLISSLIIDRQHRGNILWVQGADTQREAEFLQFAGRLVEKRLPLEYHNPDSPQLISWLNEQGADPFTAPGRLMEKPTMGCAYLNGPSGRISLLCFDSENGVVHLFVTAADNLALEEVQPPRAHMVNDRKALTWNDEENAFLLIAHDKDQSLPDVFL